MGLLLRVPGLERSVGEETKPWGGHEILVPPISFFLTAVRGKYDRPRG